MGTVGSKLYRPFRNWNIENRAHKIISREKPMPAPMYDSTKKQIELVNELEPDYKEKAEKKDLQLDEYLKKVYVKSNSTETQEIDDRSNADRPLPKDKLLHEGFQYGVHEPSTVRPGRVTLRQAVELLSNHKENPEKYTVEYVAAEYKLEKEVVENIFLHYSLFTAIKVESYTHGHNEDVVATSMPISQKTGLQVPCSDDDRDESAMQKFRKAIRTPAQEQLPIEEEKTKRIA